MKRNAWGVLGILGLGALTQCAKEPDLAPTQAPAQNTASVVEPPPVATVATPPASAAPAPVASAAPVAPAAYPMCGGQTLAKTAPLPARAGAVSLQLAPAFLDQMSSCKPEDAPPKDVLARAGEGTVDAKGDCVFASIGVSCHYHSGSEFITSSTKEEPMQQGEVHCIFPSDDPKSPRVFGAHVTCSDPSRGKPAPEHAGHEGHEVKTGAACGAGLLNQLASCMSSSKCCDDGTLTNVITDLTRDGRNDVRPDFRICEQAMAIDCSLLENMHAHTANAPALGGVGKAVFGVTAAPGAKPSATSAKSKPAAHPEKKP